MWANVENEINTIKQQVNSVENKASLRNIMNGIHDIFFPNGPGLLNNVHIQTKNLFPVNFTGINMIVNKNIGDQAKYNFSLNLDPSESEYYCPYNSYLCRESKRYYDTTNQIGFSNIVFQQDISNELKLSLGGHIQHLKAGTADCVLDYYGKNYTSSLTLSNSDVKNTEVALQHLQELNKKLAVGAELSIKTSNFKSLDSKNVSLVGRFYDSSLNGIISTTVNLHGLQLCLYKRVNTQVKIGSILDVCFQSKNITGSLACEIADNEFTLKTSIDSSGCVIVNLLKNHYYKTENITFKPTISLLGNIKKNVKLGVGFELMV